MSSLHARHPLHPPSDLWAKGQSTDLERHLFMESTSIATEESTKTEDSQPLQTPLEGRAHNDSGVSSETSTDEHRKKKENNDDSEEEEEDDSPTNTKMSFSSFEGDIFAEILSDMASSAKHSDDMAVEMKPVQDKRGAVTIPKRVTTDFIFSSHLGSGSYATVERGHEVSTGHEYAVKVVVKDTVTKQDTYYLVRRERNILGLLTYVYGGNSFVTRLYCTFQDNDRLSNPTVLFVFDYAMELCPRGDLKDLLNLVTFDMKATQLYSAEVILGLDYIHSCGIAHRDLKPENIMFKANGHIAITDFGSAKILSEAMYRSRDRRRKSTAARGKRRNSTHDEDAENEERQRCSTFAGTPQYVSPEMLNGEAVGIAADFWALGAIIFQCLAGNPPFCAANDYHLLRKITKGDFAFPPGFPWIAQSIVNSLIVIDPETRLKSPEIREHPFYDAINWKANFDALPAPYFDLKRKYDIPITNAPPIDLRGMRPGMDRDAINRLLLDSETKRPSFTESVKRKGVTESSAKATAPPPGHSADGKEYTPPLISSPMSLAPNQEKRLKAPETAEDRASRQSEFKLVKQAAENEYHKFVNGNLIVKQGLLDKKKGVTSRRRMFLITEGDDTPHIYYVDPEKMILMGKIPFTWELRPEERDFGSFVIHTPGREWILSDPKRCSNEWCDALRKIRARYFPDHPCPEDLYRDEESKRKEMKEKRPSLIVALSPAFLLSEEKKAQREAYRKASLERKKATAERKKYEKECSDEMRRTKRERRRARQDSEKSAAIARTQSE